jgi:hypothetical protein
MLVFQVAAGAVIGFLVCVALYLFFAMAVQNYNDGNGEDPIALGGGCLLVLFLVGWGIWWWLK